VILTGRERFHPPGVDQAQKRPAERCRRRRPLWSRSRRC